MKFFLLIILAFNHYSLNAQTQVNNKQEIINTKVITTKQTINYQVEQSQIINNQNYRINYSCQDVILQDGRHEFSIKINNAKLADNSDAENSEIKQITDININMKKLDLTYKYSYQNQNIISIFSFGLINTGLIYLITNNNNIRIWNQYILSENSTLESIQSYRPIAENNLEAHDKILLEDAQNSLIQNELNQAGLTIEFWKQEISQLEQKLLIECQILATKK